MTEATSPAAQGRAAPRKCAGSALPVLLTNEDTERFIYEADLSGFEPMQFEFAPKDGRVNMRLPCDLLATVKTRARR